MKFLVLIAVLAMILAACGVFGELAQRQDDCLPD